MSANERLAITGLGMVTPVGLSVEASCAAFRAGIARFTPVFGKYIDDEKGQPVPASGGRVPLEWFHGGPVEDEYPGHEAWKLPLPPPSHAFVTPGAARLAELAVPAAHEAWTAARLADRAPRSIGLYLGVDESEDGRAVIDELAKQLGATFAVERVDALGRASGLAAFHRAARHLREGRIEVALVGAVGSWVRAEAIEQLVESGRLRDDDHPQGIIPGEGAAFVVLEAAPPSGVRPLAWLAGSGVAEEPTAGTEDASEGMGITQALRKALASAGLQAFPRVICDLNGDRYRAMEWAYGLVRVLGGLQPAEGGPASNEAWHPADCIGDTGAASGLVNLAWAVTAMRKGYGRSRESLVWGGSDGVLRAAAVLTLDPTGK